MNRLALGCALLITATLAPALEQAVPETMLMAATCDPHRKTVRLEGHNLGGKARHAVFLEGPDAELVVREVGDRYIVAVLPPDLGDGAYRMRPRHRGNAWLEVPLVLGIVGPVVVE